MEFRVLGRLDVLGVEGRIELRGAKRRGLIGMLLAERGRVVPADRLVRYLWDDDPDAHDRVKGSIHELRKLFGADGARLATSPGGYSLQVAPGELDAEVFEELVARVTSSGDRRRAATELTEALNLWHGDAFEEFADAAWAIGEASRLNALRLQALQSLVDAQLDVGDHLHAAARLEALVLDHPLQEQFWAQLIVALYRCGRQAEALRAYQRVRVVLAEDLGINPSPTLIELERRVLEQDPTLAWVPVVSDEQQPGDGSPAVRPSGTVTFLFTDVEDSTGLWDRYPSAMSAALARHDEILRVAVDAHGGYIFSSAGDGIAAAFQRSVEAVRAAVEAQLTIQAEAWPDAIGLRVRMGVHTGEAQEREGNYFGPPLNRAARVMGAARGGQIVVSRATAEVLAPVEGIELADRGSHRLKGLAEPLQLFAVIGQGLADVDRPLATAEGITANLPRPATEFIGRVAELRHRSAELPRRRLVTLTGAGGVGKTRLATEIAWQMADDFPGGVWLVELASVADPASVWAAVASTLSVPAQQGMSLDEAIVDWLRGRRLLLVIDNCEHVMEPVIDLVGAIVTGCTTVTVLATSREALGIPGERVHVVASLDPASEGVELFCDRAQAADGSFTASEADQSTIAAICQRLDGIPLAIELAAARVRSMAPTDLLAHLDDRFRLVRRTGIGGLERHQTLRAVVTWSYQLITEHERLLFDRLSVFAGGFDLRAVEAVCAVGSIDDHDVADLLDSLVAKSMVVADRGEQGSRYRVLEILRQYGEERLIERGEADVTRWRHLDHYLDVATSANRLWASPRQLDGDAILDQEWDNLRGAHSWAVVNEDIGPAETLVAVTGPHAWFRLRHEHGDWATRTLDLATAEHDPVPVTFGWAANWAFIAGDHDGAIAYARHGIEASPAAEHPDTTGCWSALTWAHLASGRGSLARQPAMSARAAAANNPDLFAQAWAQVALMEDAFAADIDAAAGHVDRYARWAERVGSPALLAGAAFYKGQLKIAERSSDAGGVMALYRDGLDLAHKAGDLNNEGKNLIGVAIAAARFHTPEASAVCREALARLYDTRHWSLVWTAVDVVARWLGATGQVEEAAIVYGHLEAHHPIWDNAGGKRARSRGLEIVRRDPRADQLMARGAAMGRDEFIELVLDDLAHSRLS